jgi:hypothetical protein
LARCRGGFSQGPDLEPGDPRFANAWRGRFMQEMSRVRSGSSGNRPAFSRFRQAHVGLGTILNLRGRYRNRAFSTALDADPRSVDARLGLAEALRVWDSRVSASLRAGD